MTHQHELLTDPTPEEEQVARELARIRGLDPDKLIKSYTAILVPEGERRNVSRTDVVRVPLWRALWAEAREFLHIYRLLEAGSVLRAPPNLEEELGSQDYSGTYLEFYLPRRGGPEGLRAEDTGSGGDHLDEESESMEGSRDEAGDPWPDLPLLRANPDNGRDSGTPRHEQTVLTDLPAGVSAERGSSNAGDPVDVAHSGDERRED